MPNTNKAYIDQAYEYWQEDRTLEAGRLIFENLPKDVRPQWAGNILQAVVKRTGIKSSSIERTLCIAKHPNEWNRAHDIFSLLRKSALELESLKSRSTEQALLLKHLLLSELVAKVIYNSTNPVDEFDEDSGWWIAVCLKDLLGLLNDEDFSRDMWSTLCFQRQVDSTQTEFR